MAIRSKVFSSLTLALAIGGFSVLASAQESTTAPAEGQKIEKGDRKFGKRGGHHGRGMKGRRGGRGMGFLRGVDLTDAQKEQIKAIREANKPNPADFEQLKAIRETRKSGGTVTEEQKAQMKQFREARKAKMGQVHQQILAVLTPEQKAQLDARKAERQTRREEWKQKRQQRVQAKPADNN